MSDNYDSILKEKKVYTDSVIENKHPLFKRAIKIGIFIAVVIIIISYVIYFNTVLSSESIFLNNMVKIFDKYSVFYDKMGLSYDFSNNYTFSGDILIDNKKYNYSFIKAGNKLQRRLVNGNNNITYYSDNGLNYVNISSLNDTYVEVSNELYDLNYYNDRLDVFSSDFDVYINDVFLNSTIVDLSNRFYNIDNYGTIFERIKNNYNSISSSKYIRKVYLEDKKPIVEVDLVLNTQDINKILGDKVNNLYIEDDINVSIFMKNDAIMNEICSIKVVINNGTKSRRQVITYSDNEFVFTDDQGMNDKLVYEEKGNDISLKYYKNDLLYSVLTGKLENHTYVYMYQVIDQVYNIKLVIENKNDSYSYLLEENIDNKVSTVSVVGNYSNTGVIDEGVSNVFKYDELSPLIKNSFNVTLDDFLFGN